MDKIKEIIDKYAYDKTIKKYSNKYFRGNHTVFREISTKEDIDNIITKLENYINHYKKMRPLHRDDIIEMEKSLGEYEIAVHKILKCYDILKFKYTTDELQQLIDNISNYEKEIQEINLRRMCQ